jgi:hypothetical protein
MIRELIADLKRWREDKRTNSRKYTLVTSSNTNETKIVRSE